MTKDPGGPAYPCKREITPSGDNREPYKVNYEGMTLLDYFAGLAMQAIIESGDYKEAMVKSGSAGTPNVFRDCTHDEIAQWAFDYAEAMIAEKRRREE